MNADEAGYGECVVVATAVRERVRANVAGLAHRGLDVPEYSKAVARALVRAVPFDGTCLLTIDPATLLPTGEVVENGLSAPETVRLTEIELREPDFNKFSALARAPRTAASLSEATAGDLDRSLRHRELRRPHGFDDELRAVLSDAAGTWGALTLMREAGRPRFTAADVRFVASLGGLLADGLRRAMLLRDAATAGGDGDTGVLLLAADDGVEMTNDAADRWLDELDAGGRTRGRLPIVVHAVAGWARHAAGDSGVDHRTARARVRTAAGRWLVVRGSRLEPRPRLPGRRPAGGGAPARVGADDRRRLRLHRPRARRDRASGPRLLDERDQRAAPSRRVHGAGPLEVDLREVRRRLTWRAGGPPVLRPLRAAPDDDEPKYVK